MSGSHGSRRGSAQLARTGVTLPPGARDKLARYLELLAKWNRTYNLTAIREPERMVTHHVLDALAVLPHLPAELRAPACACSTSAAAAACRRYRSRSRVPRGTSSRSTAATRRARSCSRRSIELPLPNVEAVVARVEDYAPAAPFDVVISRAFSDLATFVETSARHLADGGRLVAMKGVYPDEEIAQLPRGFRVVAAPALTVPGLDAERHLIVMATGMTQDHRDREPEGRRRARRRQPSTSRRASPR